MVYGFALLRIKPFKEIHERGKLHFTMVPWSDFSGCSVGDLAGVLP
jgi:hypothetical protein